MLSRAIRSGSRSHLRLGVLTALFLWLQAGEAQAQALTCAAWCDLQTTYCLDEVVHDEEFCLDYCNHPDLEIMPLGSITDTTGNTLGCRMYHALQAESSSGATREAHCAASSMTGGGVCGSYCDVYCDMTLEICNDTNNSDYSGTNVFTSAGVPSRSQCLTACSGYSEEVLGGVSQNDQLFGYGDTVQCRIHHLQAAAVEGQEQANAYGLHCGHASPVSASGLCSNTVEPNVINYCVFALRHCTDDDAVVPDGTEHADCVAILNGAVIAGDYTEEGFESFADTDTNSIGCLNNRIMLSAVDAPTYCAEGDWRSENWVPAGAAVCAADSSPLPVGPRVPVTVAVLLVLAGIAAIGLHRTGET
ncbi:hypothetical protein MK489_13195 [Myxococcota bacterium]|nr:hypothetical protein [Myxococcota bacterium]